MFQQTIFTLGVCFGIGVCLAPLLPVAHAFKCDTPLLSLELDAIEGDTNPTIEQEFWANTATLNGADAPTLRLIFPGHEPLTQSIELEPR